MAPPADPAEPEHRESLVGNLVEAALTYLAGVVWYAPITALLVFGPWEWRTPEEQLALLSGFLVFSLLYDTSQRIAANIGIQPKFAARTFRLFADIGASMAILLVTVFAVVLALMKVWTPQGADFMIIGFATWFGLNDLFGNSNVVHTALRRVSEYARDR